MRNRQQRHLETCHFALNARSLTDCKPVRLHASSEFVGKGIQPNLHSLFDWPRFDWPRLWTHLGLAEIIAALFEALLLDDPGLQ